ncbi:DUF4393 domain-containing protein [Paenibacillus phytohabitans]|uniref:DUF4393 domain-containing protein n=1 Tax=Paenibacillus phytohabitans TaxID=2654978 RepID=UPI003008D672
MDLIGLGKVSDNGLEVMKMVYPDLAQPGLQKVGQALGTVLDLGNTILLPLKLANANASVFFQHHMDKYRKKMEAIPEENIGLVQPTIGLKILDELFTVTNEEIAQLFINLLTNASTVDRAKYAHPGFIDVIKNLSHDEAKLINEIYIINDIVYYAELLVFEEGTTMPVPLHFEFNSLSVQLDLTFPENDSLYIDNLEKLGVIERIDNYNPEDISKYDQLIKRLEPFIEDYNTVLMEPQENRGQLSVKPSRGRYPLTSFGESFLESIKVPEDNH